MIQANQHGNVEAMQDRMFVSFIFVSIACHVLAFTFHHLSMFSTPIPLTNEWMIDTELVVDSDVSGDAAKVELSKELLPQLPKSFSIKEPEKAEEAIPEEKKVDKLKKQEKEEEKKEAELPNKEKPVDLHIKKRDDANQIQIHDALKRLALERLREESAKKDDNTLAKISAELAKGQGTGRGEGAGGVTASDKYINTLSKIIRSNYTLPPSYEKVPGMFHVTIGMALDGRGELRSIEILDSSGDVTFDNYTLKAAKSAVPYPPPPKEVMGEVIKIRFSS